MASRWTRGFDPWHERLRDRLHDWWLCRVRRRHHVKMDSHGRCYRCKKEIR